MTVDQVDFGNVPLTPVVLRGTSAGLSLASPASSGETTSLRTTALRLSDQTQGTQVQVSLDAPLALGNSVDPAADAFFAQPGPLDSAMVPLA
jgi:hypothetical protein